MRQPQDHHHDDDALVSELASHVPAAPARTRRRKRKQGTDTLVIAMGVLFMCLVALGGFMVLTMTGNDEDQPPQQQEQAQTPPAQHDSAAVARISAPALAGYERLADEDIPEPFQEQARALAQLAEQAAEDNTAQRFNAAHDAYKALNKGVNKLETDIARWRADELAKAETLALQQRVTRERDKASQADAQQWAAKDWHKAQTAMDQADKHITARQFTQADEQLMLAESFYDVAFIQAQAGQRAETARKALIDKMAAGDSQQSLRKHANEQVDEMLQLRDEGNRNLNTQQYEQAEEAYQGALAALDYAQQRVDQARYRKFYAFDAGIQASALLLATARGDGVSNQDHQALIDTFKQLGLTPNPARRITPGEDTPLTSITAPLVNDARDAITKQFGETTQACYLIGFHTSIVEQTLKTNALTKDQQRRIHQSLTTIEEQAAKAGWDLNRLQPLIEQTRNANRRAKTNKKPEEASAAWARLLGLMHSKAASPQLMDPDTNTSDPEDPELFPNRGS